MRRPEPAASPCIAHAAALPGIGSAELADLCVVALDDQEQLPTQLLDAPVALVRAVGAEADFGLEILFSCGEQVSDGAAALRPNEPRRGCSRRRSTRPLSDSLGSAAAAQHGPSGLRAVAGAASATSAAGSPPRKRASRRRRGRARPGRGMSRLRSEAPRCPMEQKRLKDTLGLTLERVSGVPLCGLEMCLVQAGSAPVAGSQESRWSTGSTR